MLPRSHYLVLLTRLERIRVSSRDDGSVRLVKTFLPSARNVNTNDAGPLVTRHLTGPPDFVQGYDHHHDEGGHQGPQRRSARRARRKKTVDEVFPSVCKRTDLGRHDIPGPIAPSGTFEKGAELA